MNSEEVVSILAIMKTAYPAFYKDMKEDEVDNVINLWTTLFANDSAKVVTEAVKALICTLKFPPTIADVKEKIALINYPDRMTELEAWGLVKKAINGYNPYNNEGNKEMFNALPVTIRKIIGSPNQLREWGLMDSETVNSVIQSNFMRSFTARQKQEENFKMLPESTKELIASLSGKMSLLGEGA